MNDMKIPNIKTYTCSDGFVTDNEQVAKSHEINIKNKKLLCPFCQQELEIWHTNRVRMYACPDLTCKGYYMSATKDMWQELITTRKALDWAMSCIYYAQKIIENYKATKNLYAGLDTQDTTLIIRDINETIKRIETLEQINNKEQ